VPYVLNIYLLILNKHFSNLKTFSTQDFDFSNFFIFFSCRIFMINKKISVNPPEYLKELISLFKKFQRDTIAHTSLVRTVKVIVSGVAHKAIVVDNVNAKHIPGTVLTTKPDCRVSNPLEIVVTVPEKKLNEPVLNEIKSKNFLISTNLTSNVEILKIKKQYSLSSYIDSKIAIIDKLDYATHATLKSFEFRYV
jgi:hypothetical protein